MTCESSFAPRGVNRTGSRRGAAIVEFALAFMLFIVILLTLMEVGRAMWTYATLAHAARQAGRYCMVRGSLYPAVASELQGIVEKSCLGLDPSSIELETKWKNPDDGTLRASAAAVERGDVLEVKVKYPFRLVTGSLILPQQSLPMSAKTRMVVAN